MLFQIGQKDVFSFLFIFSFSASVYKAHWGKRTETESQLIIVFLSKNHIILIIYFCLKEE